MIFRSVPALCAGFGFIVGGYIPAAWGASLSLSSLLFSVLGGAAGLMIGLRLSDD